MPDTFRALCAELLNGLDELAHPRYPFPGYTRCAIDRARTLLAQPESEKPADDKLMDVACATDLVFDMGEDRGFASPYMEEADITAGVLAFAHEVLAKYGNLPQDQ